jgi:hypothetical protein
MKSKLPAIAAGFVLLMSSAAYCDSAAPAPDPTGIGMAGPRSLAQIVPGWSTKREIESLFGAPWRVVQFNDCGDAMSDHADESWEYRASDASGSYRIHVEFDEHGVVHLIARIPDGASGGAATVAKVAPTCAPGFSM